MDARPPFSGLRRIARRLLVTLAGAALLVLGTVLLVLPGPGVLVLVAGLAVLATEFTWAERPLRAARSWASKATRKVATARR